MFLLLGYALPVRLLLSMWVGVNIWNVLIVALIFALSVWACSWLNGNVEVLIVIAAWWLRSRNFYDFYLFYSFYSSFELFKLITLICLRPVIFKADFHRIFGYFKVLVSRKSLFYHLSIFNSIFRIILLFFAFKIYLSFLFDCEIKMII